MSFANIFSQSVACLLILLTLSFTEQKFLILIKSSLSMISFMEHAFGVISKCHYHTPNNWGFLLYYLLEVLEFYVLRFRSMIHFRLIFIKHVRSLSRFVIYHVDVQLLPLMFSLGIFLLLDINDVNYTFFDFIIYS